MRMKEKDVKETPCRDERLWRCLQGNIQAGMSAQCTFCQKHVGFYLPGEKSTSSRVFTVFFLADVVYVAVTCAPLIAFRLVHTGAVTATLPCSRTLAHTHTQERHATTISN